MPLAELHNVSLNYELHGEEGAPVVAMLHAATHTFRTSWGKQIEPFADYYRVLGVDLRGHGLSTNPADRLDLREMADDLANLLDYLTIPRIHLLGYSGGGSVALFFAARHTERLDSLVMISNNMALDRARTQQNYWDFERIKVDNPAWVDMMMRIHKLPAEDLLRWWGEEDVIRPDWSPSELVHIDVPTLVMGGDSDEIIPLKQTLALFDALPRAQLCILPGVGHGIPMRRAEIFNPIVQRFLRKLERETQP